MASVAERRRTSPSSNKYTISWRCHRTGILLFSHLQGRRAIYWRDKSNVRDLATDLQFMFDDPCCHAEEIVLSFSLLIRKIVMSGASPDQHIEGKP